MCQNTYNPCHGAPRIGKVRHEHPDEDDRSPARATGLAGIPLGRIPSDQPRDDKVATCHSDSSGYENRSPAKLVDPEHGGDSKDELEDADHPRREQGRGASAEAQVGKDERPR